MGYWIFMGLLVLYLIGLGIQMMKNQSWFRAETEKQTKILEDTLAEIRAIHSLLEETRKSHVAKE